MSTLAAIICLSCVRQKLVVPVQFARPSTGRHGPLSWPPVAVNQWNTLTLTRWLVLLKEGCRVNKPLDGCAPARTSDTPSSRPPRHTLRTTLPNSRQPSRHPIGFTVSPSY